MATLRLLAPCVLASSRAEYDAGCLDVSRSTDDPSHPRSHEHAARIAAAAFAQRGLVPLADPSADDVPDPYRKDREAYLRAASLIDAALAVPLALLLAGGGSELGAQECGGA